MKRGNTPTRRQFVGVGVRLIATVPLVGVANAWSADLPILAENDPVGMALGYVHDATHANTAKFPKRAAPDGATQFCNTCLQYAATGGGFGTCTIFPGKRVAQGGWCNVWLKKA